MNDNIKNALLTMDSTDDDQWTQAGEPVVSVVEALVGSPVTRQSITDAWPEFNRKFAKELEEENDLQGSDVEPIDEELVVNTGSDEINALNRDDEPKEFVESEDDVNCSEILEMSEAEIQNLDDSSVNRLFDIVDNMCLEIEDEMSLLKGVLRKLGQKHEALHAERNKRYKAPSHADNVAAYFATQDKDRVARNESIDNLIEKGVDAKTATMIVDAKLGKRHVGKRLSKAARFLNKKV